MGDIAMTTIYQCRVDVAYSRLQRQMNRTGNALGEETDVVAIGGWCFSGGTGEWGGAYCEGRHLDAVGEGDGGDHTAEERKAKMLLLWFRFRNGLFLSAFCKILCGSGSVTNN